MAAHSFSKKDSAALKGIAILLLVFYHCFSSQDSYEMYRISYFPFPQNVVTEIVRYCKVCVCIFAFISGYGLYQSWFSLKEHHPGQITRWIFTRILKTLSGFWFVAAGCFIMNQVLLGLSFKIYFSDGILPGLIYLLLEALGFAPLFGTPTLTAVWWYMGAASVFIILLPILSEVLEKYGAIPLLLVMIALPRILGTGYPSSRNPLTFLVIFVLGMCFSRYSLFEKLDRIRILSNEKADQFLQFFLGILLLLFTFRIYMVLPWSQLWEISFGLCPLVLICFCRKYIVIIPGLQKLLMFLGRHSMNIYLIHNVLKNRYLMDVLYHFRHFLLIPLVLLIISLIGSICIEWLKKITGYDRFFQAIHRRIMK